MSLTPEQYEEAVTARRNLQVALSPAAQAKGMKSLSDVGWDGHYVVPNQLSSCSLSGPVILLNNWYGWEALEAIDAATSADLRCLGYLRGIPTNRWLDRAIEIVGLTRADIYVTQACIFLPKSVTGNSIPDEVYTLSVTEVLSKELGGRTPIALGNAAQRACRLAGIPFVGAQHPSYQGGERRAQEIASAIRKVTT